MSKLKIVFSSFHNLFFEGELRHLEYLSIFIFLFIKLNRLDNNSQSFVYKIHQKRGKKEGHNLASLFPSFFLYPIFI